MQRKSFVAMIALALLSGCSTHAERVAQREKESPTFTYTGPALSRIAVYIRGTDDVSKNLAINIVRGLQARGISATDVTQLSRLTKDKDDLLARLRELGYAQAMTMESDSGSSLTANVFALDVQTQMKSKLKLISVNNEQLWTIELDLSASGIGRHGRLVKGTTKRIINTMIRDGVIPPDPITAK